MADQNVNEANKKNQVLDDSKGISYENYENNFADVPQAQNNTSSYDLRDRNDWATTEADFSEETAAEVAPGIGYLGRGESADRPRTFDRPTEEGTGGRVMGAIALALSILSLFYSPVLFGAAGIIIGFMARRRGANGLGNWAMGIGVVSLIIGLFIAPFFY